MELFEYIDILKQPYDIFYTDNENSPLHWHYYSELIYMISGSVKIKCNDRDRILVSGNLCYLYPLQLHEISKNAKCRTKVKYAVIKFNIHTINIPKTYLSKMYDYFIRRTRENDFCIILEETESYLTGLIKDIVSEYENKKDMYMFSIQTKIQSLLIQIARNYERPDFSADKRSAVNLSFYHILEYIDIHSGENLKVENLASMCNMSYSNFAKLFRENYGRSCNEYIQYIRLNKAQDLLFNSDYDLDYIAQETGFFDCSHFIKAYKKWRGITPKKERMMK